MDELYKEVPTVDTEKMVELMRELDFPEYRNGRFGTKSNGIICGPRFLEYLWPLINKETVHRYGSKND